MILWYRNSFWASVVSMIGCAFAISGIGLFTTEPAGAVVFIVVGVILAILGKRISDNKAFKVWWKQVVDANLIPEIVKSSQTAVAVYNKNPQERTLKKIAELNPSAAQYIRSSIAAKKK